MSNIHANPNQISVLDHGFVKLRNLAGPTRRQQDHDAMGWASLRPFDADDTDVANAARLSFEGQDRDRPYEAEMKLTRYLLVNQHSTPFESIEIWLEMKLPIFVARQFVRQRTQSINEASARYIQLPAEWYIPDVVGGKPTGGAKQGQSDTLPSDVQLWFKEELSESCRSSYRRYEAAIKAGVAPEHARLFLHVNHYTHWMTKMNLRNLLFSLLALRDHSHAQIEAQVYARAIVDLLEPHIPGLVALYKELVRK